MGFAARDLNCIRIPRTIRTHAKCVAFRIPEMDMHSLKTVSESRALKGNANCAYATKCFPENTKNKDDHFVALKAQGRRRRVHFGLRKRTSSSILKRCKGMQRFSGVDDPRFRGL